MNDQRTRLQPRRRRILTLVAVATLLGTSAFATLNAPQRARAADFSVGDTAVVDTDRLNLRDDVGTDADVVMVLTTGMTGTVTDGPQTADGYDWYELDVEDGSVGWAAGDFLALAAADDPGFNEDDVVAVFDGSLNLRADAGLAADILAVMADGSTATVLSGPVTADGLPWYEISTDDYGDGWAAGGFLALVEDGSNDSFPVDTTLVVATDDGSSLNLRDEPTTGGTLIDKLTDGDRVTVLDGPVSADGYDWYHVDTDLGTGWVAGDFLVYPSDVIAVGDDVSVVDGTLNLREEPGLEANVLTTLPDGTVLTVTDGPEIVDGWTWFEVENDDFGPGWVAGEFLTVETAAATPTPTPTATATATLTTT